MFFARLGLVVVILVMVAGVIQVATGLLIATEAIGPYEATLARYFPNSPSSGKIIDAGILKIIFAIVVGIIVEIRYALREQNRGP
jgi:hypothetical protein